MNTQNIPECVVYTDGSCLDNPGPGGYAGLILYKGELKLKVVGGLPRTTNNQMELMAVVETLKRFNRPSEILVYSDSKYVVDSINKGWAKNWCIKGQLKRNARPNSALWIEMMSLLEVHNVHMQWVKGHNDNKYNELCDKIAVEQALMQRDHRV